MYKRQAQIGEITLIVYSDVAVFQIADQVQLVHIILEHFHSFCLGDFSSVEMCIRDRRWTCLLQKALGEEYLVIEEGLSGRTCVYDDPDMDSVNLLPVLHALLNSHEPLDLLILMLGTNDSKVKFNTDARKIAKEMCIRDRSARTDGRIDKFNKKYGVK